ncbi:secreted protein [Cladochytrium replicatum]|nr:secreted protein [Cladochytrium replicatum]
MHRRPHSISISISMVAKGLLASLLLAATAANASPVLEKRADPITVTIDPSYQHPAFEGWGTSLAWLAVVTGAYPDSIRSQLVSMLYGPNGLNLNIARYNIGGGNAPTVKDYLRPGGAVPGWWKAPQAYGPNDKDWWDPNNADHWNWNADPYQRWWIDQIKGSVTKWEAFSNSPPWFQTVSGYVSGGIDATAEQIRSDKLDAFSTYLVKVAEKLESVHGIKFSTLEPINEPNTNYWKTTLDGNGVPTGGRQEGAHVGPALQSSIFVSLKNKIASSSLSAKVSAPDETNPSTFLTDYFGYTAAGAAAVDQLNVHTYGTSGRPNARDLAKSAGKPLWMSEVEGSWGNDFTSMNSGLGMAQQIIDDIRELEPSAWILWQPIEDRWNMVKEGNLQWGEIHVPFNCTSTSTLSNCAILTNTKYNTVRQFTRYIRPGDRFVKVSSTGSTAAIKSDNSGVVVVHTNSATSTQQVTLDFSGFSTISSSAKVTPVTSSASGALVTGTAVAVSNSRAVITVPASSVTTFIVSGVSGVNAANALIQSSKTYRIQGVQSSKYLQSSSDGNSAVINTLSSSSTTQRWTFRRLTSGTTYGSRDTFAIVNGSSGKRLSVSSTGATTLEADSGTPSAAAQWILSTTGNGNFAIVNSNVRAVLDVNGASTADNAAVITWQPNGASNQAWKILAV